MMSNLADKIVVNYDNCGLTEAITPLAAAKTRFM